MNQTEQTASFLSFTLDRIENDILVFIDDKEHIYYAHADILPDAVHAVDGTVFKVLLDHQNHIVSAVPDPEKTEKRREIIAEKRRKLLHDSENGSR
ncbi:MAG: DUF3006 domain-containing protein [Clostridia bacterium]|nr:DUF3006 domain-containing protein [Clostridia bacterium]